MINFKKWLFYVSLDSWDKNNVVISNQNSYDNSIDTLNEHKIDIMEVSNEIGVNNSPLSDTVYRLPNVSSHKTDYSVRRSSSISSVSLSLTDFAVPFNDAENSSIDHLSIDRDVVGVTFVECPEINSSMPGGELFFGNGALLKVLIFNDFINSWFELG